MMATFELDPLFVKALRLLYSKSKDSAAQLRTMVDDAIASRKSSKMKTDNSELDSPEAKKAKRDVSPSVKEDRKEKEREKEKLHKKEKERREQEKERERLEKEKQKEQEREREKEKERALQKEKEAESDESTEEDDKPVDADDFAFGLGVCCQVCSKFDMTPRNQLVECQECHALYHQECHRPPVTGDVGDPRFVWYCNRCVKSIKKIMFAQQAAQKPQKSKPAPPPASSSSKESSGSKTSKSEPLTTAQPFKRMEVKLPSSTSKDSQNSSSSQPLRGLASLAANLTKGGSSKTEHKAFLTGWKTEPTKTSHKDSSEKSSRSESSKSTKESKGEKSSSSSAAGSSSSSGKGNGGNGGKQPSLSGSAMANANKRLQLMKKAAAKQQEKRVHVK